MDRSHSSLTPLFLPIPPCRVLWRLIRYPPSVRHNTQNCAEYGYCAISGFGGDFMQVRSGAKRLKVRGKQANTQFSDGLGDVVQETTRLWRKHHLGYDQTKYVVEQARRRLKLLPPGSRRRTVNRLDKIEVERLIQSHSILVRGRKKPARCSRLRMLRYGSGARRCSGRICGTEGS